MLRIGIDIGGTFTDFVVADDEAGTLTRFKLLSTPADPAKAVLDGLSELGELEPAEIVHGSTVATNALLERKGARTAFIATQGFADMLQIARQNRQHIYDLSAHRPEPLVRAEHCWEIDERISSEGEVLRPFEPSNLDPLVDQLAKQGIQSVAVCLLFSFLHKDHEKAIGKQLRKAGFAVSLSSEILPEFREYERASTTTIDAYVTPVLASYLEKLDRALPETRLRVMQSNGGSLLANEAAKQGVRSLISGPAGGVLGAIQLAGLAGFERIITLDMGGTSTDVSLAQGAPRISHEISVAGFPVRVPMIDIHSVGSGGGSIARVDAGGALRVGPESAGASPGPACYALDGQQATVTDANLILGRISPDHFLGGRMALSTEKAAVALEQIASEIKVDGTIPAALGIIQVVNAQMARAMRVISVERGHDPADFTLVCYGGAGALHAIDLARLLSIQTVLIPRIASTQSAFGLLTSNHIRDYGQTVMLPEETPAAEFNRRYASMMDRARKEVKADGFTAENIILERQIDLRYRGQSYELTLPYSEHFAKQFHQEHEARYSYSTPDAEIEIVNLRVRAIVPLDRPELELWRKQPLAGSEVHSKLEVVLSEPGSDQPIVQRIPHYTDEQLFAGMQLSGPAIVSLPDTTILLHSGDDCEIDMYGNFVVSVRA
jgi:N-methylhydantoinase A